jgi:hypothetical protein
LLPAASSPSLDITTLSTSLLLVKVKMSRIRPTAFCLRLQTVAPARLRIVNRPSGLSATSSCAPIPHPRARFCPSGQPPRSSSSPGGLGSCLRLRSHRAPQSSLRGLGGPGPIPLGPCLVNKRLIFPVCAVALCRPGSTARMRGE